MTKARIVLKETKIRNEFQSLRYRLLYLIYCAPKSRIKDEPGIKSKICKVMGFSSDGHFYHHFNNLTESGLIEQQDGYICVTKDGKREFEILERPASMSIATIFAGLMFLIIYIMEKAGYSFGEPLLGAGIVMLFLGILFYFNANRYEPKLSKEARRFLKGLNK